MRPFVRSALSRSAIRAVFVMLLFAVLLVAVYGSVKRGLAEVVAQEPRYRIELGRTGKSTPDAHKLDAFQVELDKALNLDPANPKLLEDIGQFHASRVERADPDDPKVRATRRQALASFRQALELRPTSSRGYFNVALMKYRLNEVDQEFSQSLQQAMRRGPWEPKVQLLAIELGIAAWQGLADPARETLKQAIQAQARWQLVKQKPALQLLLKRYRRADLAYLLE